MKPVESNQNQRCAFDTNGDGDCHRCVRRGGCEAIGGPFGKQTAESVEQHESHEASHMPWSL